MREPIAPRLTIEPEVLESEANRLRGIADRVTARSHALGEVSIGQDGFGLVNLPLALAFDQLRDGLSDQLRAHARLVAATADAVTSLSRDVADVDSQVASRLGGRVES